MVALLATVTPPVKLPVEVGAKVTFSAAVCPGARIVPEGTLLPLKPAPEVLTPEIVTLELPEFVNVTVCEALVPVDRLP